MGKSAKSSRNAVYGAVRSSPERASARTQHRPGLGCGFPHRLFRGHDPVDGRGLVGLRQDVKDFDNVGVDVDVTAPVGACIVGREGLTACERGGEAPV